MLVKTKASSFVSVCFSYSTASLKWRNGIQRKRLVSQVSSLLLQRTNWAALLPKPLLVTDNLFCHILHRTQSHPRVSLDFFNYSKSSLGFQPDLRSQSKLISILLHTNLTEQAKTLLEPLLTCVPVTTLVDAMLEHSLKGTDASCSLAILNFLLEIYSNKDCVWESLQLLKRIRTFNQGAPSITSCNALLDALCHHLDTGFAWPCYGLLLRLGAVPDSAMWTTLARLLCREGKLDQCLMLLNSENSNTMMYDLVIESYSNKGNLVLVLDLLNKMEIKGFGPNLRTYSSILDGACKFEDSCVIDLMLGRMVERCLLPTMPFSDYDAVIEKFCRLGKSYAAGMLLDKCRAKKIDLRSSSYVCLLKTFCKEGRKKEATNVYQLISAKGIRLSLETYNALWSFMFQDAELEEIEYLLKDALSRGFMPSVSDLSRFLGSLCGKGRWIEAVDLLNLILDKGCFSPSGLDCCSLVEYYCSSGLVDVTISLHDKIEKLGGCLDVSSYNTILERLAAEKRTEEAIHIFDYMRLKNVLNSKSFLIMITALCCEKEMRKAMIYHDEMVKKGLKPDEHAYTRLIYGFT